VELDIQPRLNIGFLRRKAIVKWPYAIKSIPPQKKLPQTMTGHFPQGKQWVLTPCNPGPALKLEQPVTLFGTIGNNACI